MIGTFFAVLFLAQAKECIAVPARAGNRKCYTGKAFVFQPLIFIAISQHIHMMLNTFDLPHQSCSHRQAANITTTLLDGFAFGQRFQTINR